MAEPAMAANGKPLESVWDFPRPPRIERVPWRIEVRHGHHVIVDAPEVHRVLETSQPPAYYVHPDHVALELLGPSASRTFCEWKGWASYVDVVVDGQRVVVEAGWRYDEPTPGFAAIAGHYAFYAQKLSCSVDGEAVAPNAGSFYGGWITANVTGPFKGAPGTSHW